MNIIYFNEELGNILQFFRKSYDKTATNVADTINRKAPYLSKLESGQIKKISSDDFITICNYISDSEHGIESFIETAFRNVEINYSEETLVTLFNIDEVLYQFPVPKELVTYLFEYITKHNIEIDDILSEYNANNELSYLPETFLKSMTPNLWYNNPDGQGCSIKLEVSAKTLRTFFSNKLEHTNYIFIYAILYTIYKLSGITSDKARIKANKLLQKHDINKLRLTKHLSEEDLPKLFGDLEPHVQNDLEAVIEALKLILFISQSKGGDKRIATLKNNLSKDLGYTFAFISTDINEICALSREKKMLFLKDLKKLVEKYSSYKESDIDLYLEE